MNIIGPALDVHPVVAVGGQHGRSRAPADRRDERHDEGRAEDEDASEGTSASAWESVSGSEHGSAGPTAGRLEHIAGARDAPHRQVQRAQLGPHP